MRELMSEISNTIKHRHLNHTRITRTRKWLYNIIGINMIVNIRIFVKHLFYRKNLNNEQYWANNRALRITMYVNIMRRRRGVNFHIGSSR